jgi:putative aldouronate transport system substrate-binding protein
MFGKSMVSWGLAFCILLSGCGSQKPAKAVPRTYSVLYNNVEATPFKSDWLILQEYQKRKNVTLDVKLGDNTAYDKDIARVIESGNIPDIILKCWPDQMEKYANSGVLLPFSDYESLMPNFMAYIKKNKLEGELDKLRLANGKYYILPGYQRDIQVQQWIYRKDAFADNKLSAPKTYDELFDSLVALKMIYPESTPITACWNGAHLFAMMGYGYSVTAGWAGTCNYSSKENQWQYSPATPNYRELYRFLNRCYAAGILDPETFTQGEEDFIKKLEDGRALTTVTWITSGFSKWNQKMKDNGIPAGEWAALPVMESTVGIKALPPVNRFKKGLVVPSRVVNEPYFKDLLGFLDWAGYSEEGMTLTTWGVEGVTYQKTDAGKAFLPTIITPKNPAGTVDVSKEFGVNLLFNQNEDPSFEDYKKPDAIVAFLNNSSKAKDTPPMAPKLRLDAQDIEAIRLINANLDPYMAETSKKFILGELSLETDWDAYISSLESRGYKTLETIWNSAWTKQK